VIFVITKQGETRRVKGKVGGELVLTMFCFLGADGDAGVVGSAGPGQSVE